MQVVHQHVPQDANLVLSQDELKLGEQLILHLRGVHSTLPDNMQGADQQPTNKLAEATEGSAS